MSDKEKEDAARKAKKVSIDAPRTSSSEAPSKGPSSPSPSFARAAPIPFQPLNDKTAEWYTTPEFVYGGPFKRAPQMEPFLDIAGPFMAQLQGNFMQGMAYYCLKDRLPVILTRVIDTVSKLPTSDPEVVHKIAKLKSELLTNKRYAPFEAKTEEAETWNNWIDNTRSPYYFTNAWSFTECYVYKKLNEAFDLSDKLRGFDPFAADKRQSFSDNLYNMCMVAPKIRDMMSPSERAKRKQDFVILMKLSLWSNKNDLSLTGGDRVDIPKADPFVLLQRYKENYVIDESSKAAEAIFKKSDAMRKKVDAEKGKKKKGKKGKKAPPPPPAGDEPEAEPVEPVACPAKKTVPNNVYFDIVCDNAGYELFMDMCIGLFLIQQNVSEKIRFHLKKIPWFVSDATPKDFEFVVQSCENASVDDTIQPEREPKPPPKVKKQKKKGGAPPPPPPEDPPPDPIHVTSPALNELGRMFREQLNNGNFMLMSEDFWTNPHCYKDMKKYDFQMYRKLQYAVGILFKGDLNYRKLVNDTKWMPYDKFEPCLQGFIPAPILAIRTVKSDLICGIKKRKKTKKKPLGMYETINAIDEKWMEKGNYGLIQYCPKGEALKVSDRPCPDWPDPCKGKICPDHPEL